MARDSLQEDLSKIVEQAIAAKVCPGATLWAADAGRELVNLGFGMTRPPLDGGHHPCSVPVTPDTIFDVASVTKAASTSVLLMQLVGEGKLALEDKAAAFLPELCGAGSEAIEVRDLLGHASGLPAHIHFFDRIWSGDLAGMQNRRDALVAMAGAVDVSYPRGSQTIYSDLGYILLGRLIERVGGAPLDVQFAERIAKPLGMESSRFLPIGEPIPELDRIAPSQVHDRDGLLRGRVHDDNCRAGGGVCGHAGLFSTAADLGRLALELCAVDAGQSSFVSREVLRRFWDTQAAPDTTWRLGWDTPSETPGESSVGDSWPRDDGYGHFGFTGCAMWLAPKLGRAVVLLSNRVYYSWEKTGIRALRQRTFNAVMQALPVS